MTDTIPTNVPHLMCEWFVRCENEAVGTVEHPTLGHLPTCQRCADRLDLTFSARYTDQAMPTDTHTALKWATVALCVPCWNAEHPDKAVSVADYNGGPPETCNTCGASTLSGIYVRRQVPA